MAGASADSTSLTLSTEQSKAVFWRPPKVLDVSFSRMMPFWLWYSSYLVSLLENNIEKEKKKKLKLTAVDDDTENRESIWKKADSCKKECWIISSQSITCKISFALIDQTVMSDHMKNHLQRNYIYSITHFISSLTEFRIMTI